MATSVKDRILETLSQLPLTATVEDAMERLYFLAKVEHGVADLDAGRVVAHNDIKARYLGSSSHYGTEAKRPSSD